MEGTHFDAWFRRRFGMLASASLLLATATGTHPAEGKSSGGQKCRQTVDQTGNR